MTSEYHDMHSLSLDNWALLYAQKLALKHELPLIVCFCVPSQYLHATYRQYYFMLEGLKEVEQVSFPPSNPLSLKCLMLGSSKRVLSPSAPLERRWDLRGAD